MTYLYDGTYEGLLTAIFESYRLRTPATHLIVEEEWTGSLFEEPLRIETEATKATRVLQGVKKRSSADAVRLLYRCFLSELPEAAQLINTFVRKQMAGSQDITDNYADDTVLRLHQISKQIGREVHRMHAFVRFQRTRDDIYYSVIEPDFNVLPLLPDHFEKRYPAQHWLIYDSRRRYGIYYDQQSTEYITFDDDQHLQFRQLNRSVLDEAEPDYQQLWKRYFESVNIPERKNMKLHLQHVPRRYWKYLSEKRDQFDDAPED